ncbi:MAG: hypothetical protein RBT34_09190, partial [Anaerolineaceae bacterium]|jgi:hypothetical protein|nr:hypothetical protein [Anaerolineaceae bacterium]
LFLARAIWTGEPKIAVQVVEGLLAEAQGDRAGTIFAYQAAANHTQQRILHNQHRFMLFYTAWFNRRQGITDDFVPGYLQLDRDYGQFDALEKLHQMYVADAQCENAEKAWVQWQRALRGGALESLPPAPTCGE